MLTSIVGCLLLALSVLLASTDAVRAEEHTESNHTQPTAPGATVVPTAASASTNACTTLPTDPSGAARSEWALPDGQCFVDQPMAAAASSSPSYAVSNAGGIAFWDEYRRLGGVDLL